MAPMAVHDSNSLKRSSSKAQFAESASKKQHRGLVRHGKARWDPQLEQRLDASIQNESTTQSLLMRSIGLALEAVGFGAAAPNAMESMRLAVEAYMAHYLTDVRQSMLSSRRTQTIPQDFLQALHTHQLSLRSLLPHLKSPIHSSRSQFALHTDVAEAEQPPQLSFLGPILTGPPNDAAKRYVPRHFPGFPSKHTYKETPEYPDRDQDPRAIRERAAEEGRFGEEALRRLVGANSGRQSFQIAHNPKKPSAREKRNQVWQETMRAVMQEGPIAGIAGEQGKQKDGDPVESALGDGRLASAVNADKKYWRKPVARRKEMNGSI